MKLLKMNLRVQLILLFAGVLLFGEFLPDPLKCFFYTLSISFRTILLFCVPFIIFSFSLGILIESEEKAIQFMSLLVLFVCLSYFFGIMISHFVNVEKVTHLDHIFANKPIEEARRLLPLWHLELKPIIKSEAALLVGLLFGLLFSIIRPPFLMQLIKRSNKMLTYFMRVLLIKLLPLFVLGFILELDCQGILGKVFEMYLPILGMVLFINILYMLLRLGIDKKTYFSQAIEYACKGLVFRLFKTAPVLGLGLMPYVQETFEKTKDMKTLKNTVILEKKKRYPTNRHIIRDCFCVPIIMIIIMFIFDIALPGFAQYMNFTQFYMITRFMMPAVPSASLFVFLPGFENYLGFTPEIAAFIMAFYILLDPVITIENVLGRHGLIMSFTKRMQRSKMGVKW